MNHTDYGGERIERRLGNGSKEEWEVLKQYRDFSVWKPARLVD